MKILCALGILAGLLLVGCGDNEQGDTTSVIPAKSAARSAPEDGSSSATEDPPERAQRQSQGDGDSEGEGQEESVAKKPLLDEEAVAEALEVAVDIKESLEVRADGLYYDKNGETVYGGWVKELHPDGTLRSLEMLENGMRNGASLALHANGERCLEGVYRDNAYDGTWQAWHSNGEWAGERNYLAGVLQGPFTQVWGNGQKMMEGVYELGKMTGVWEQWYENGKRQSAIRYQAGEILSASYWNSKGEPVVPLPDGTPSGPLQ